MNDPSQPTGWNSLPGDPSDRPYGLPLFRGERVSVSVGRLGRSYWHEHTFEGVRIVVTFKEAAGLIEPTQGDHCWIPSAFLAPHQFCIIPAGLETTLDWLARAEFAVIYVEPDVFGDPEAFPSAPIVRDYLPLVRCDPCFAHLIQMFLALCHQAERPAPEFVEGIGMALASRTLAQLRYPSQPGPTPRSGLPPDTVNRIANYVEAHLEGTIRTRDLARHIGLSPDHFARRFKITAKVSPKQFVLRRRMEKVHVLLESGNFNVTQAGEKIGMVDPGHLSRRFRQVFGYPPMMVIKAALAAPGNN